MAMIKQPEDEGRTRIVFGCPQNHCWPVLAQRSAPVPERRLRCGRCGKPPVWAEWRAVR